MFSFMILRRPVVGWVTRACVWAMILAAAGNGVRALGQAAGNTAAAATDIIGTVVAAQGDWCDQVFKPCRALWKMYPITESSQLVPVPPFRPPLTLTVRSRWGVKQAYDCAQPRELGCKQPLDLSSLIVHEPQKNVVTALYDAVLELAAARPKVYDSFRQGILQSRGSDRQQLTDGVAELSAGGLNIESIMGSLPAGEYRLELCPVNGEGKAACSDEPAPLDYNWDPKQPALYPARDAHPGIYCLYRWDDSAGAPRRTRFFADVLVAEPQRYAALQENFRRVVDATGSWDSDDSTAPALRRAYLYTLSQP